MNIKLADQFAKDTVMMRSAITDTIIDLAREDERVCVLDADLMSCIGTGKFQAEFPDRFYNCGIAEANMMGIGAGMSAAGLIPFVHTFGPFATRRSFDQIFISAAYAKLNLKIIGSDPGISAAFNGGTHMPFEDVGIMRTCPGITILEPADNESAKAAIKIAKENYGVYYIRVLRKEPVKIYEPGTDFERGRGMVLREGKDVAIIATGMLVAEALKAHDELKAQGISAKVVNIWTIKPLDEELVAECAKETGAIVTAENHNVMCGLGEAVASALCRNHPAPIEMIGAMDRFGEVGPVDYLAGVFKMRSCDIVEAAKKAIAKK